MDKIVDFYKQTSQFTFLGKYKQDAIDLWQNKCGRSLKSLCLYFMNATVHRVVVQMALNGADVHDYGDFSFIDYKTPMSEDDFFITAASIYAEIFRRDEKGFYLGRPVEKRLVLTCRYISVLVCATLKANGIACRSRAGWARYLDEGRVLDHWVNEYYDEKSRKWIMFDLDDLYDAEWMDFSLYQKNNIANEYLNFGPNQFYTGAEAWLKFRKDKNFIKQFAYGSGRAKPEQVLKYLFLDFFAVMNTEYNYTVIPICYDKPISKLTTQELAEIDNLATLMLDVNKNFSALQKLFNTPKLRMVKSPLVGKNNYEKLIKAKGYKI